MRRLYIPALRADDCKPQTLAMIYLSIGLKIASHKTIQ